MNKFLANLSQVLAHSVRWEQEQLLDQQTPQWREFPAFNFDIGGGSSEGSSKFTRKGTTGSTRSTTIPDFLSSIINTNMTDSAIPTSMAGNQNNFLTSLLTRNNSALPGMSALLQNINMDPTSFTGSSTLTSTASRDPFSSTFASDTAARYQDSVAQALAQVVSGPDNVRGGQNRAAVTSGEAIDRMALNRNDEIRRAQLQDVGIQQSAAQIMAAIESGRRAMITGSEDQYVKQFLGGEEHGVEAVRSIDARRGINTGNTALAARELGVENGLVTEDLKGKGSQAGSSSQWGVNVLGGCCFIFLEALNGQLPWFARKGRDMFQTPARTAGYVRMSRWLVPLMARNKAAKHLVNTLLVKPFLKLGAWFFGDDCAKTRWRAYWPYCALWFTLWGFLGRKSK